MTPETRPRLWKKCWWCVCYCNHLKKSERINNIQFPMECENDNKLPFPDCPITRNEDSKELETPTHRKETHANRYSHYRSNIHYRSGSNIPKQQKQNHQVLPKKSKIHLLNRNSKRRIKKKTPGNLILSNSYHRETTTRKWRHKKNKQSWTRSQPHITNSLHTSHHQQDVMILWKAEQSFGIYWKLTTHFNLCHPKDPINPKDQINATYNIPCRDWGKFM